MGVIKQFTKGLFRENPVFMLVLGLCPTLAVSTTVKNAIGMGLAATFVLVFSNTIISCIRKIIPEKIRIPCFIVVIASFVTIVELLMAAYSPTLSKNLGIFVPLIVVNCIILGRAEAFASKNKVLPSFFDGLGMGIGFSIALVIIGAIREVLGAGELLGISILRNIEPIRIMVQPAGALVTLGILIGLINFLKSKNKKQSISF
ncbi:MAG: electron transport complex subunit E [Candidatus Omnitrophica bacterium]|nr:electron transport complex subunit E [Candidatus Omnitrophota bacterium]